MKIYRLFLILLQLFFPLAGISQIANKDSISFVHSFGMIDEKDSLSVLLANELYRISIKAKEKKYPPFYGGVYIKNKQLIFVLSDSISMKNIVDLLPTKLLPYSHLIPACFSYYDLLKTKNVLETFYFKTSNKQTIESIGWSSWYLSIEKNKIMIRLKECNDTKIRLFKSKILDSPMLQFIEADKNVHI